MEAFCITVISGVALEMVLDVFGCHPGSRRDGPFPTQYELATPYPNGYGNDTAQIDRLGDAVAIVEANGWAGTEGPRPARLSRDGRTCPSTGM